MTKFTKEELESMRRWDEEIENSEMTLEDFEICKFVDELLSPEKVKNREYRKNLWEQKTPEQQEASKKKAAESCAKYYQSHKEQIAKSHASWYQRNKERIRLQQQEYRIRAGKQMTPEQKAKKKAETAARRLERLKEARAQKKALCG